MSPRKPHRVRFAVSPIRGVFGWELTRDGVQAQTFLFKFVAVRTAALICNYEWDDQRVRSELVIKGRDGKIQDTRSYGDDPPERKG